MKVLKTLKEVKFESRTALTLGFFDGLHKGHRLVISGIVEYAAKHGLPSLVFTFLPPTTRRNLVSKKRPFLTSSDHKIRLIEEMGVDYCYIQKFTKSFLSITAPDFLEKVLFPKFKPDYICVGSNFRFGRNQRGTAEMMRKAAEHRGVGFKMEKPFLVNGRIVSSSRIRKLIESGRIETASDYLGRAYSVLGTVIKGKGLGTKLGFPTANLDPHNEAMPPLGVYATKTRIGGKLFGSVT
ncbi:MAG: riboflavin kinase, partial [bacterium]|nr:riboflavin kinase [bacterium]